MTTTNRLSYTASKRYVQGGTTFEINAKILLADDCKNNICNWSITADIYEQRKNGRFVWCAGGFNKFVSSVNRSLLPAGITFKMK